MVSYDMEGLSGITDWHMWDARYPEQFAKGQKLLAGEINAVVDGLFAGGASAVDVFDQHGSGRPDTEPDMPLELLDHRAKELLMSEVITQKAEQEHNYDAVITIGGHSAANSGGFAGHTISSGTEVLANGIPLTEVSLIAYQWGETGVPLIMAAGEDTLKDELKDFPWIEYVVVKHSRSGSEAELIPLDRVHADLRAAALRSVQNLAHARVATLTAPITIVVGSVPPGDLSILKGIPGVNYQNNRVTFSAPKLDPEGAEAMINVTGIAQQYGHLKTLEEFVHKRPDGEAIMREAGDLYVTRWLDYETQVRRSRLPAKQ
jgi:D-amino peptidase